jgi:hypothetical protein
VSSFLRDNTTALPWVPQDLRPQLGDEENPINFEHRTLECSIGHVREASQTCCPFGD